MANDEGMCIHELIKEQCGLCKSPPLGINEIVYVTRGGQALHNWSDCAFLLQGQLFAESKGFSTHDIRPTRWSSVYYSLGACEWCCALHHLRGKPLRPCEILIEGRWEKAFHLKERFINQKQREHQVLENDTNAIYLVTDSEIRI
jgi:hypothetical protein